MRLISHAKKLAVGVVCLFAVLGLAAPASAGAKGPELTTNAPVQTVGVAVDVLPDAARTAAVSVVCFRGHVEDIGWQGWDCDNDGSWAWAGTTGQYRRLEALQFVAYNTGGFLCGQAHVQDYGWMAQLCVADGVVGQVGTTGEYRRMEALGYGHSTRSTCAQAHVQDYGWMASKCASGGYTSIVGTTGEYRRMEAVIGTVY